MTIFNDFITSQSQADRYYQALVEKDSQYLGTFIVGVISTGICCLPTCRARKPKRENCEFYRDLKSALLAGFRPCKICQPEKPLDELPDTIQQALALLAQHQQEKLHDWQLREANLSPEAIRRWFQKHYGMTFQTYQRMIRINTAMQELTMGKSITDVALNSGYESLSGFGYTFKKMTGFSPNQSISPIVVHRFNTPIGPMFAGASENGLCLMEFTDRRSLETELRDLQRYFKTAIIAGENEHTQQAEKELSEYFAGNRLQFDVTLDLPGTAFQQAVWQLLTTIPYGKTYSYQQQAERLNNPKAIRAVATANGANRVSIIVPCHRVIGKDGSLTGYGGGLPRKKWLLEHEAKFAEFTLE